MPDDHDVEPELIHRLKNELGIIVSFCDLLLDGSSTVDDQRADFQTIRDAAQNAMSLVPEIARRLT